MTSQSRTEMQIRLRLHDQVVRDLEEFTQLGNFRSSAAAAEHILNCFVGPTLRQLQQTQRAVENLASEVLPLKTNEKC